MKPIFLLYLALLSTSVANAQIFRSQAVNRGASPRQVHAGNEHGDRGRYDGSSRRSGVYDRDHRDYGHHRHTPYRHYGYLDRNYHRHSGFGYFGFGYPYSYYPSYSHFPSYGYYRGYGDGYPYYDSYGYYGTGSAATNGLLLGALAGGVIGNNSGEFRHNAWRGSAWGAGLGWLLGSVVDYNRRNVAYQSAPPVVQQAPAVQMSTPTTSAAPQPVTIINNYYNSTTPMSGVNGMFGR